MLKGKLTLSAVSKYSGPTIRHLEMAHHIPNFGGCRRDLTNTWVFSIPQAIFIATKMERMTKTGDTGSKYQETKNSEKLEGTGKQPYCSLAKNNNNNKGNVFISTPKKKKKLVQSAERRNMLDVLKHIPKKKGQYNSTRNKYIYCCKKFLFLVSAFIRLKPPAVLKSFLVVFFG